jgi:hypothetical protein
MPLLADQENDETAGGRDGLASGGWGVGWLGRRSSDAPVW